MKTEQAKALATWLQALADLGYAKITSNGKDFLDMVAGVRRVVHGLRGETSLCGKLATADRFAWPAGHTWRKQSSGKIDCAECLAEIRKTVGTKRAERQARRDAQQGAAHAS